MRAWTSNDALARWMVFPGTTPGPASEIPQSIFPKLGYGEAKWSGGISDGGTTVQIGSHTQ